jgi:16S rRNA (uracil1498-N3)-methyltransferase
MSRPPRSVAERWFLAADGRLDAPSESDARHAVRVLRLEPGARVLVFDGAGGWAEVELAAVDGRSATWRALERRGRSPGPGEVGSDLPYLEIVVAPPKGERCDAMVDRLAQLGAAAITFLAAERTQGFERARVRERLERWRRIAVEACKQAQRLYLPELRGPLDVREVLATAPSTADVALDPRSGMRLADVAASLAMATRAKPARLWIGPEGGWSDAELAALMASKVTMAALAPHVLRVETAAEAAAAIALHASWRPR